jgi:hypothetical protein
MENEVQATVETAAPAVAETKPLKSWEEAEFTPSHDAKSLATLKFAEEQQPAHEANVAKEVEAKIEQKQPESDEKDNNLVENEKKSDLFKVKVDGEEVEVSLDELKSNFSGKQAFDKKFSALDKERKQFLKEKQQIESYVNEFRNLATSQNMVEATKFLGHLTGKAPHAVVEELINSLHPEIERRYGLTTEELTYEKQLADAQYKAELLERQKQQFERQQIETDLNSKIETIMSEKSIPVEEWDKAVLALDARLPKDQDLTPELVAEYVVFDRAVNKTGSLLSTFDSGKLKDNTGVANTLRDIILENPDFTDEDLTDILKNSFVNKQKEKVEEKLVKKVPQQVKQTSTKVPQFKKLTSWDDII